MRNEDQKITFLNSYLEFKDLGNVQDVVFKNCDVVSPLKQYDCDECGGMTLTPIFAEVEKTIIRGEIEMDVPVVRCFCSNECKQDYINA